MSATTYYINELSQNLVNANHYVYIDSVDGNLDIKNNKWFFGLNFYMIMDVSLPMNMLNASISLPFAAVDNISINRNSYTDIPLWIQQKDRCQVYQASFNIDVSDSKFFSQMLTSYDMYASFKFDYDADVVNKNTFTTQSSNTNNFLNELNLIDQTVTFKYTNYLKAHDESGWFNNSNSYYLNNKTGSSEKQSIVYYQMNQDCEDLRKPITHLLNMQATNPTTIISTKTNFYYSIGNDPKILEYKYENSNTTYVTNSYDIDFTTCTSYDTSSKQVSTSLTGNPGFMIPETSVGYFEVEVKLSQQDTIKTYVFHKSFNFIGEGYQNKYIHIKQIFINDVTKNFKRMVF